MSAEPMQKLSRDATAHASAAVGGLFADNDIDGNNNYYYNVIQYDIPQRCATVSRGAECETSSVGCPSTGHKPEGVRFSWH